MLAVITFVALGTPLLAGGTLVAVMGVNAGGNLAAFCTGTLFRTLFICVLDALFICVPPIPIVGYRDGKEVLLNMCP